LDEVELDNLATLARAEQGGAPEMAGLSDEVDLTVAKVFR
jgi:hypothetical protein